MKFSGAVALSLVFILLQATGAFAQTFYTIESVNADGSVSTIVVRMPDADSATDTVAQIQTSAGPPTDTSLSESSSATSQSSSSTSSTSSSSQNPAAGTPSMSASIYPAASQAQKQQQQAVIVGILVGALVLAGVASVVFIVRLRRLASVKPEDAEAGSSARSAFNVELPVGYISGEEGGKKLGEVLVWRDPQEPDTPLPCYTAV
ncbi:hypothetical protein FB45DRAFT_273138 [Roridomyces roridus]|uniref:Mid2 domain-containing protein n=1 Tax=Roridomyces roridus TaxID=1738132 RepID=A0AAD7B8D4_9AGAR|nr:hypothetical protein FB45DRAFT_273138 [Roridomyces roridus]